MVEYSIAICNYNMAKTVEESLRSILDQLNDSFEVVVVDDGSDDGSLDILRQLEDEYATLRIESLAYDESRNLGGTRNRSFRESRGKYVMESLDTDDRYSRGILDFVEIYHQIEAQVNFEFYLKGRSINMAPRDLLLRFPYRNFARGQDRDLWRRLFANDAIIWLEHEPFFEPIGYEPGFWDRLQISYGMKMTDFRSGVTFPSFISWSWNNFDLIRFIYHALIAPPAVIEARLSGRYEAPEGFDRMGALEAAIRDRSMTLREVESEYDLTIDEDALSERGREIFL